MIRHISIFFFREEQKEANMQSFEKRLEAMEAELERPEGYQVGRDCMERPPREQQGVQGIPEFGDLVQIIDFACEEDAVSYVDHPAHVSLLRDFGDTLEKVVAFDLRV